MLAKSLLLLGILSHRVDNCGSGKIIECIDLSTQNDLSRSGQMIPFVLGIITVIEGGANARMPKPFADSVNHYDPFEA